MLHDCSLVRPVKSLECMVPSVPDYRSPQLGLLASSPVSHTDVYPRRPLSASDLSTLGFLLSAQGLVCSCVLTSRGLTQLMFGAWLQCHLSGIFPRFLPVQTERLYLLT